MDLDPKNRSILDKALAVDLLWIWIALSLGHICTPRSKRPLLSSATLALAVFLHHPFQRGHYNVNIISLNSVCVCVKVQKRSGMGQNAGSMVNIPGKCSSTCCIIGSDHTWLTFMKMSSPLASDRGTCHSGNCVALVRNHSSMTQTWGTGSDWFRVISPIWSFPKMGCF